jgi:hypothetical protein
VCKVVPLGMQRFHTVANCFPKPSTQKITLSTTHKSQKIDKRNRPHVPQTPPKICGIAARVGRVLLFQHCRISAKNHKNKVSGAAKHTQKVILQTKSPLFGLQHQTTSPLSISPPPPPSLRTVCTTTAVHTTPRHHSKQRRQRPKGGGQKFFFASNQPFLRSFSL